MNTVLYSIKRITVITQPQNKPQCTLVARSSMDNLLTCRQKYISYSIHLYFLRLGSMHLCNLKYHHVFLLSPGRLAHTWNHIWKKVPSLNPSRFRPSWLKFVMGLPKSIPVPGFYFKVHHLFSIHTLTDSSSTAIPPVFTPSRISVVANTGLLK